VSLGSWPGQETKSLCGTANKPKINLLRVDRKRRRTRSQALDQIGPGLQPDTGLKPRMLFGRLDHRTGIISPVIAKKSAGFHE